MKLLSTTILSLIISTICLAQNYDQQWSKIDSLEHYRDFKIAIPFVDQLMQQAKQDVINPNAKAHYVKALLFKNKYEIELQLGLVDSLGLNSFCYLEAIDILKPRLLDIIKKSKDPIVNALLYTSLADLMVKYQDDFYVCNRIPKVARAISLDVDGNYKTIPDPFQDSIDNILRLYKEEASQYLLLASAISPTQKVWARDYAVIIEDTSTLNNPLLNYSLYDVLVNKAIDYIETGSRYTMYNATLKEYPFRDSLAFVPLEDFVKFDFILAADHENVKRFQIYTLYQDLLRTHLKSGQRNLLAKFDLERMIFSLNNNRTTIQKHKSYYLSRLLEMEQTYSDVSMGTMISYEVAKHLSTAHAYRYTYPSFQGSSYDNRWNVKKAHDLCLAAIKRFPKSVGAKNCQALLNKILQKELSLSVEAVNPINQTILAQIQSKNIDKVYCKLLNLPKRYYKEKAALDLLENNVNRDSVWAAYIRKIKTNNSITWEQDIPLAGDFKSRSIEVKVPAQKSGAYLLVLSHKADFSYDDNGLVYAYLQVSDLAFLARARPFKNSSKNELFVLNRKNGAPIERAKVQFLNDNWKTIERQKSDQKGYLSTKLNGEKPYLIRIKKGKDQLHLDDTQLKYYNDRQLKEGNKAFLFTDKPIYRPGQTIAYKAILTHYNKDGTSKILPNQTTKISFFDANQQRVAEEIITSNEYGAYSGRFEIPSSTLLGEMHLQDSFTQSKVYFDVEEYKKPSLKSKLKSIILTGEKMDTLLLSGTANTFSGMPLIDAQVNYFVVKDYTDTLKVGRTVVNNEGHFYVKLLLEKETDSLVYSNRYTSLASIIDLTGETDECRSSTSHYNPLFESKSSLFDFFYFRTNFKHELDVLRSSNALIASYKTERIRKTNQTPIKIKSTLIIEQLETPKEPYINRLWSAPDTSIFTIATFEKHYPLYEAYAGQRGVNNWAIIDSIYIDNSDAASQKEWRLNTQKWATGTYRIRFSCEDSLGVQRQENPSYFRLVDQLPSPFYNMALGDYTQDSMLIGEPKDTVFLEVGSYFEDANILLELENNNEVHEYRWLQPKSYQKVPVVIDEQHRGNLHYRLFSIYNNRFREIENSISVPWSNKELNIEYLSFRDKLIPGQEEEWTIKITGPNGEAVAAEVLASMYDSALDQLTYRSWNFDLYKNTYRSHLEDWSSKDNIKKRSFYIKKHPNWQLPELKVKYLLNPSVKYAPSLLAFNQFWYSKPPTPNDLDGDGVPNDQDTEPNSLPIYPVDRQGQNLIPAMKAVEEKLLARESFDEVYIDNLGVPMYSIAYADGSVLVVNDENYAAISVAGIPAQYGDPEGGFLNNEIANRRNFTFSNVTNSNFDDVKIRSDLKESVFFYPNLKTNEDGSISIKFKMSEALSRWKFRAVAHTKDLKTTISTRELVSQKKLMVMPSTPRFLRQGDQVEITSKVANLSEDSLNGKITLQLFDAITKAPIDHLFKNQSAVQTFDLEKEAVSYAYWSLEIPENWINPVLYKVIAKADNFSDGEQNQLPVLSNRMLVVESLPILANGNSKQTYTLKGLKENQSPTLQHHQFSLEFSANPAWDALFSLPYLMEYPYECSEQLFSRFYANSLATQILNSTPNIKSIFDKWATTEISSSNLDKLLDNPSLKSALLEETPWILNDKSDAERLKHLGQLFQLNKLSKTFKKVGIKLLERQSEDGGFPWFKGGVSSPFITQYIVSGMAKLEHLGANPLSNNKKIQKMNDNALAYMDQQIIKQYQMLDYSYKNKTQHKKDKDAMRLDDNLSPNTIQYLYAKSFFWNPKAIEKDSTLTESINYYLEQANLHWRNKSIHQQAILALAIHRINAKSTLAQIIVDSLRNQAVMDSTEGMYWNKKWSFHWYELPIETQAVMIELFDEVAKDSGAVYLLKLWLLQQKKGTAWASTKATTMACYALLLSGKSWLNENMNLNVQVGSQDLKASIFNRDDGIRYAKKTWPVNNVRANMATIVVENENNAPAFGAAYWQYFENFEHINSFQETPLKIKKKLFLQTQTTKGIVQTPIEKTALEPGDLVLVKIEIEVNKDMEYLHLKDMRAAGFEPINVLSRYKYQNGMGYYEMTKDASNNFFFSKLIKGKYIFEYTLRAVHKGEFSNGITTIQSMYAPEFTAHSKAVNIIIE